MSYIGSPLAVTREMPPNEIPGCDEINMEPNPAYGVLPPDQVKMESNPAYQQLTFHSGWPSNTNWR